MTKTISIITMILVGAIAIISFVLSYAALRSVALLYGVPAELSYLWPGLVDGALVVFSLAVIRATLLSESNRWPWLLVGGYSLLTVVFNLFHAQPVWQGWFVAAMPPITLVLSFESLMNMLKSSVQRTETTNSLETITKQLTDKAEQVDRYTRQLESVQDQIAAKKEELKQQGLTTRVFVPDNITIDQRRSLVQQMVQAGYTNNEMGELLQVHFNTIKNDKVAIGQHNGHG